MTVNGTSLRVLMQDKETAMDASKGILEGGYAMMQGYGTRRVNVRGIRRGYTFGWRRYGAINK